MVNFGFVILGSALTFLGFGLWWHDLNVCFFAGLVAFTIGFLLWGTTLD